MASLPESWLSLIRVKRAEEQAAAEAAQAHQSEQAEAIRRVQQGAQSLASLALRKKIAPDISFRYTYFSSTDNLPRIGWSLSRHSTFVRPELTPRDDNRTQGYNRTNGIVLATGGDIYRYAGRTIVYNGMEVDIEDSRNMRQLAGYNALEAESYLLHFAAVHNLDSDE